MFLNEDDKLFVRSLVTTLRHLQNKEGRTRDFYSEERLNEIPSGTRELIVEALNIVYRDEATA